jgi:alpha-tubulin suppressor-like RCC1 family protein
MSPVLADVTKVAAGATFSLALHSDGTVHVFGANGTYGMGDGTTLQRTTPVLVSGIADAVAIAAGVDHALAVRANGTVVAWGNNQYGKLGDGTTTNRYAPVDVSGLSNIVAVAAAGDSSLALDSAGNVWAWGLGFYGVLGRGNTQNASTPVQIPSLSNVSAIAAGRSHAVALVGSTVWTWGLNTSGQLGIGTSPTTSLVPVQVPGLNVISGIGAAQNATFAFAADSGVWGWGDGVGLGDGTTERRYTPIVLADGGGLWRVGTPQFSVPGGSRSTPATVVVTSVTPGATVRYTTTGAIPTEADAVVPGGGVVVDQTLTLTARAFKAGMPASNAASATYTFSVLPPSISPGTGNYTTAQSVTITNQTAGASVRYTLDGSEPTLSSPEPSGPIPVATQMTLKAKAFKSGWTSSSTAAASYYFNYGTLPTPTATPGEGSYTTDQTVTLALSGGPGSAQIRYTLDGSIPGTGSPLYAGPITVGSTATLKAKAFHPDYTAGGVLSAVYTLSVATPTFTQAAGTHPAGQVVAIATNTPNATIRYTLTGVAPTTNDAILPPGATLTLGNYTLKAAAWRTGFTTSGVATAAYEVTGDVTPARVAAGGTHTLTVRRDGTVWATGNNGWGMLGDGSTTNRSTPVMVAGLTGIRSAAAGASHSVAVGLDGRLWAWGQNTSRQLGDNTSISYRATPTLIAGVPSMVAVAAGTSHSLALSSTGEVFGWGGNGSGQVGNGTQATANVPVLISGLTDVVGIAAGDTHSLAWTASGALYAWGGNGNSQLGDGTTTMRTSPVLIAGITGVADAAAGTSHSLARTTSGQLRAWGRNYEGQLGDATNTNRSTPSTVPSLAGVQVIAAGANHSLASTGSNTFAWGANASSQVGDGTTTNRNAPVQLAPLGVSVALAAGTTHSVALDTSGIVWTWGAGGAGQLGNGATPTQSTPAPISGGGQTWGVAEPTANPAPGTYDTTTSVSLTSPTPGAQVRYTTSGVDPVESDPEVPAVLAITQTTTIKARAWKQGLTPSAVRTFGYVLKLPLPTMTSNTGPYTSAAPIELFKPAGHPLASLRYTLDGNPPDESSSEYSAPFTLYRSATVKVRAFETGWAASDVASSTYEVRHDLSVPTLTARVRPGVNAQGWTMMAPATVTFICNDAEGPLANCPAPISVPGETAGYPYSGSVQDAAGHVTEVSGVLRVDATPPALTLTSPVNGVEVSTNFVTLTGTASDAMSGLDVVRCNDVVATVSNGNVTCDVPLRPGRNPVVLQASDVAGHSTSVGIVVWRTAAVDRLTLSPQQMTLHEGDEVPLRLVNNMGRVQTGATWEVSAPAVIEVDETDAPMLRALGPGTATVTATVGPLTAQATVTVVGATIVLVPGTTRWLVQGTPGLELRDVIYTHQTNPDVPEAVLVEAVGDSNVQLRGVSDGVTTSITPVSGNVPGQTMGDSFGGVLLVQTVGERTSLQRVGFMPEVAPWRWVSSGSLVKVVQTHDGTIFALEFVVGPSGALTAASVVVLDGATGTVRARVPITTSGHYEEIAIDCHAPYNEIGDGIGASSWTALSTVDNFGVVIHEETSYRSWIGSSPDAYCGPGQHGSSSGASYLLTVDKTGASTQTQLSQFSETWPSEQGNSSTPAVTGLAPDARGNLVVSFTDLTSQVYGPEPSGPALAVGDGSIVSDDGVHVARDGSNVVARDIDTGAVLWSVVAPGTPVAFASGRRRAVLMQDVDTFTEVGPDAAGAGTYLAGSALRHRGSGLYTHLAAFGFQAIQGTATRAPLVAGTTGNTQKQGSPRFEAVPMMVPDNPYEGQPGNKSFAHLSEPIAEGLQYDPSVATFALTTGSTATVFRFLLDVSKETAVYALISHMSIDGENFSPPQATGLCLRDFILFTSLENLWWVPGENCYGHFRPVTRKARINVGSDLLFLAGCKVGPLLKDLIGIHTGTTQGKALIYAKDNGEFPRLGVGAAALAAILREWRGDVTIQTAVDVANQWIQAQAWITGAKEQYEVVGDLGLKAPRR